MKLLNALEIIIKNILWPLVILGLGIYFALIIGEHLLDRNKLTAATNRANCEIELIKLEKSDKNLSAFCKDIFDSARR